MNFLACLFPVIIILHNVLYISRQIVFCKLIDTKLPVLCPFILVAMIKNCMFRAIPVTSVVGDPHVVSFLDQQKNNALIVEPCNTRIKQTMLKNNRNSIIVGLGRLKSPGSQDVRILSYYLMVG